MKAGGYNIPSEKFIYKSVEFLVNKFGVNNQTIFILVFCSDDPSYLVDNANLEKLQQYFQSKNFTLERIEFIMKHIHIEILGTNIGRATQLALLALMDHKVISVGTFSWWAGFLRHRYSEWTEAEKADYSQTKQSEPDENLIIYYSKPFLPNSGLSRDFSMEDSYLPHWIGIDDS